MSKSKVIVKRLNAIQNFGAMNILCTDKTGTLTQDHIILEKHLDTLGNENEEVLHYGYLNSYYQTGLKNLLDIAVLENTDVNLQAKYNKEFQKIDEIPFDFNRRRMSVVLRTSSSTDLLVCKGAVEETLAVCTNVKINGVITPLTPEIKDKLNTIQNALNEDGLRVLGVSYREFPSAQNKEYKVPDEQDLVFMGFLAFLDPPKLSAEKAIAELNSLDVEVKFSPEIASSLPKNL